VTPHTPALQVAVPPPAGQTLPHTPQLLTVFSAVSQPFGRELSQSPKPVLQLGAQVELEQLVVPCALVHAAPQAPQCAVVEASAVSQPLLALPSQFPKPPLQLATPQLLPEQRGVPFAALHMLPQKPQLPSELVRSVSHVTPRSPSHSPRPATHGEA
jgi:hypothetical protein